MNLRCIGNIKKGIGSMIKNG